jgi:hypothetical protein
MPGDNIDMLQIVANGSDSNRAEIIEALIFEIAALE